MKKLLFLIVITTSLIGYAQYRSVVIQDANSGALLSNVFLDFLDGTGVYTSNKGIALIKDNNCLKINHLGYEIFTANRLNNMDTIRLIPSAFILSEVSISNIKDKKITVFPKRALRNLGFSNIGTGAPLMYNEMNAIFIPNEADLVGFITEIIMYPTDYDIITEGKFARVKNAQYSAFKVNLYSVDSIIGIPLKPYFTEDFTAIMNKGENSVTIKLPTDDYIKFPKEGIFVVLSSFNKDYYKTNGQGILTSPAFLRIATNKKSKFKQYKKLIINDHGFWQRDEWYWSHHSVYFCKIVLKI